MENEAKLFELAKNRLELPNQYVFLEYQRKANLLKILFSDKKTIYSKADMKEGIIYDYDTKDNLVGVEILDFKNDLPISNITKADIQITDKTEIKKFDRAARRKNRKSKVVRQCCTECNQPKHYICLTHHNYKKKGIIKILANIKRNSRKFYFHLGEKLGFAERSKPAL
jgi:uncharacterized protein YuzE